MGGEVNDARLGKSAVGVELLDPRLGGAGTEIDLGIVSAELARDGAQFVGRLGQRWLMRERRDVCDAATKQTGEAFRKRSPGDHDGFRPRCLLWARLFRPRTLVGAITPHQ